MATFNKTRLKGFAFAGGLTILAVVFYLTVSSGAGSALSQAQLIGQVAALTLAVVGITFLVGRAGMPSLGQGAFVAIGAYTMSYLRMQYGWPTWLAVLVAVAACAVLGGIIAWATGRLRGPQLVIVTLFGATIVYVLISQLPVFGQFAGYPNSEQNGTSSLPVVQVFGISLTPPLSAGQAPTLVAVLLGVLVLTLIGARRLMRSKWGLSLLTIKESELLAAHLGINVLWRKISVFALASALAGMAGVEYALLFGHLQPESFVFVLSINLLVMAILGGNGTVLGPLVGTAIILWLQTSPYVTNFVKWEQKAISHQWYLSSQGIIGVILILLIIFMREGIVGTVSRVFANRSAKRRGRTEQHLPSAEQQPAPIDEPPYIEERNTEERSADKEVRAGAVLSISGVGLSFGGIRAVTDVSLSVDAGEILALIGPNGAGKSTVANMISGVYTPDRGTITLNGRDLKSVPAHLRRRGGIARTFQAPILLLDRSVIENVLAGSKSLGTQSWFRGIFGGPSAHRQGEADLAAAQHALERVGLLELAELRAGDLSYGRQRGVELARAIASSPEVLILDEPAAGLNASEAATLSTLLLRLRDEGLAILIVEHDMPLVRRTAGRIVCLASGQVLASGLPDEVLSDKRVMRAYLGSIAAEITSEPKSSVVEPIA
ncbi:branched-chain amino acid ABC transporter ATP-binding protein/permease [Subtercola lobariae]|uniref:Branched-chain amino acid ABC transporter permease n=1 Tax=Subtercola lobariae TaxID=1588641 RepID=A0A917BDD3_9MICO|nr:branched-chain amino acid ABC transporter ATP-binding protein/permease [Subtercola lobariae]GGF35157.1 branched-chain amino acid ABC transporter permease [Subtercola lobariae]